MAVRALSTGHLAMIKNVLQTGQLKLVEAVAYQRTCLQLKVI